METLEQTLQNSNSSKTVGEGNITVDPLAGALSLYHVEKLYINNVLSAANNNKTKAAKVLGISLKTLYNKLARYSQEVVDDTKE